MDSSVINIEDSDSEEEKVKTKRAKKSNHMPKEEKLSSNEVKLANIITQLCSKYQCDTPPTYSSFGLTHDFKSNTQRSQSQSQSTDTENILGSNFVSALQECLNLLTNILNSARS
ncbi:12250_t:CDS:2 [Racocetra persica]|uniref:12250_t:CDS:1 n=1 Tax=Racocetra persica TaxID=160502 RepID=A0ACA9KID1_9GLOM|nr:12250_t:CDS:2 [Racocetra persica]